MRAKRIIVFLICAGLAAACVYEIWSAASFLMATRPEPMNFSDLKIERKEERWIGSGRSRRKETFTLGDYSGRQVLITGDPKQDGWFMPPMNPHRYEADVQDLAAGREAVVYYRFHPYVSFSIGALVVMVIFSVCALVCYGCIFFQDWT